MWNAHGKFEKCTREISEFFAESAENFCCSKLVYYFDIRGQNAGKFAHCAWVRVASSYNESNSLRKVTIINAFVRATLLTSMSRTSNIFENTIFGRNLTL